MKWLGTFHPGGLKGWRLAAVLIVPALGLLVIWFANASFQAGAKYPYRFDFQSAEVGLDFKNSEPEVYLSHIKGLLSRAEYVEAVGLTESLLDAYPNFQLGQWLYAELLSLGSDATDSSARNEFQALHTKAKASALPDLKTELSRRLDAMRRPYQNNTVPSGLGYLAPGTKYFGVVDASASRMYVIEHNVTDSGRHQFELLFHSYASVGLNGINKQFEGDSRSPVGVYFTQKILPDKRLPDLYGAGALTLNYPNNFDLHRGRSGSGIWIHGSPSAQYSRAPQATDGCIVLPNDAMQRLLSLSDPRGMPIIVQENIKWISSNIASQMPENLVRRIAQKYPMTRPTVEKNLSTHEKFTQMGVLHYFSWLDQGQQVALVDLATSHGGALRTYWVDEGGNWNLISESRIKRSTQPS